MGVLMEFIEDSGKEENLFRMLQMLTFETNFFKRIQALEVINNMLEDNLKDDNFEKFMKKFTDDPIFMRKARLISIMEESTETALEYYGYDYISTPDFEFDERFQAKRRTIDKKINEFCGRLMKEISKEEDLFADDDED